MDDATIQAILDRQRDDYMQSGSWPSEQDDATHTTIRGLQREYMQCWAKWPTVAEVKKLLLGPG